MNVNFDVIKIGNTCLRSRC